MDDVTCVVIGDLHIRTREVEFTDIMLNEILEVINRVNPIFVVVLGDTLHTNSTIEANPLTRAVNFLSKIDDNYRLILLIGNHDIRNNKVDITLQDNPEHPFTALHKWKNTTVVDKVTVFDEGGFKFCAVPYVPVGVYHEKIKDVNVSEIKAFFSHTSFRGVRYKLTDEPADCKDIWPEEDYPINIVGHDHEYQIVRPNLFYTGTPVQQDFGSSPDKALCLFHFNSEGHTVDRIPLVTTPIRSIHNFDGSNYGEISDLLFELQKSERIRLVKIRIKGTRSVIKVISKSPYLKILGDMKHIKIELTPIDENTEDTIISCVANDGNTFAEMVSSTLLSDPNLLQLFNQIKVDI